MTDSTRLAVTGDSFITRRLTSFTEPEYQGLLEVLREATAAFTNLEMLLHDFEGPPMLPGGGTHARGAPVLAEDLRWAGFDLVARANNHAGDYGVDGMRQTTRHLDAAGLVHAGVGESLAEAREARYLETGSARIALVSASTTFPPHAIAADPRQGILARPGLNPLRIDTEVTVTSETYEELVRAGESAGFTRPHRGLGLQPPIEGEGFWLGDHRFRRGAAPGVRLSLASDDVASIRRATYEASQQADLTLVSIHVHEGGQDLTVPPDPVRELCRQLASDGADIVVCHGAHRLRGLELVAACPIFHGLGNFIFQNETVQRLPAETFRVMGLPPDAQVSDYVDARYDGGRKGFPATATYWETVAAVPRWEQGRLTEIVLHPVTLGFDTPRPQRGRPRLATGELADRIMADFAELSKPYGTRIVSTDKGWCVEIS